MTARQIPAATVERVNMRVFSIVNRAVEEESAASARATMIVKVSSKPMHAKNPTATQKMDLSASLFPSLMERVATMVMHAPKRQAVKMVTASQRERPIAMTVMTARMIPVTL